MSISRQEFARRRRALMAEMEENSIAILPAAPERTRNRDVEHPYRQDSDFWYLSGFPEPEAVMALIPGREHGEFVLFCRERDRAMEIWNGYRAGPEGAVEKFGADDAFPINDIDEILPGLIEGRDRVYYDMGRDPEFDRQVMSWVNSIRARVRTGAHPPGEFLALTHVLHDLRLYKSAGELKVMRRAGEIAAAAHVRAMRAVRPGMFEYQLEAEYLHEFMQHGARSPAYPSIVGGGANGCILHYIDNSEKLRDGDLVLVDAGCEYHSYASDITRTFPVNGRFSREQQALYEVVLAAQYAAIEAVRPGNHWNAFHEASVQVLTQGLVDLGLLKGGVAELIETEAYRPFYMHRTGHWLGLDVHDVGDYKVDDQWRVLEPGMVLTVEPGLYVAPDDTSVDARWRGIGIRIEDDLAVTRDGHEILTGDVPKEVADIHALMSKAGDAA
ncbi:Xaa-Pro aminopeptidase [Alcanivorax quisquiliarum]|uniref:Xaa-Pro aminopeptidase n=1 Tax=Alcanivorax quisquiliarum TaxID=2933565 RepID=A0ABT0E5G0_9GAMM|nr:Xaa-Pro aminopeptidase [Alcanivorax quisquiliarum]MCK0537068.1 Xaa-Pro aminopeptidase [Alcanivorax quisquiliarum]